MRLTWARLQIFDQIGLKGIATGLAGPDADNAFDRADENLAVPDTPGLGCGLDGFHRRFDTVSRQDQLDFDLGQEIDDVFSAAIEFGMPFCRPKPLASITVRPCTPISCRASFTSSSLKGFMIASIFFITDSMISTGR